MKTVIIFSESLLGTINLVSIWIKHVNGETSLMLMSSHRCRAFQLRNIIAEVNDPILDLQSTIKTNTISWTQNQISITTLFAIVFVFLDFKTIVCLSNDSGSMINSMTTKNKAAKQEEKNCCWPWIDAFLDFARFFARFLARKNFLRLSKLISFTVLDHFSDDFSSRMRMNP